MDAVLAISLFHRTAMSRDVVDDFKPSSFYTKAIRGLQRRSELLACDRDKRHAIILTILLLLTAVMVTGFTDFPVIFAMLESAIDAIGGVSELGSGVVPEFLIRQLGK